MPRVSLIALIFVIVSATAFAEETHQLERIVVTPSRISSLANENSRSVTILDKESADIASWDAVPDVIGNIGGIDIRRRGPEGVQADISIRGTTFEQNTVLIDGVNVNDPQTGHYSMDLPLTTLDIDRIEILKGPASSVYGPNSFGGVVNIITKKADRLEFLVTAEGGSFDYFNGGISLSCPFGQYIRNRFSVEESWSRGYMPETESDIFSLSDNIGLDTYIGKYNFLFGYLYKDFGAANFYSNLFPNEKERTDTRFFKIDGLSESGNLKIMPKLFLRRHKDKFALDRNRPGWQTSYHTTYTQGLELDFALENDFMDIAYGSELSRDTIDSTSMQTQGRNKYGIYLELSPHLLKDLYLNIGMRSDWFSRFGWEYAPSVNASYALSKELSVRGLIGRAYRIPTFTDLYYNDSGNRGNSGLRPENCWTYETGLDYKLDAIGCSATFFHRDSYDTIDWTRPNSQVVWQASNIGSTETNGFELSLDIMPKAVCKDIPVDKVFFKYTTLDTYAKHNYLSKYALDYLKQQISGGIEYSLFGFRNPWVLNYKKRIGDSGFIVVDTKVAMDIVKKGSIFLEAYLEISNLFDVNYSEQSDIQMPGRWIRSGAKLRF